MRGLGLLAESRSPSQRELVTKIGHHQLDGDCDDDTVLDYDRTKLPVVEAEKNIAYTEKDLRTIVSACQRKALATSKPYSVRDRPISS